jgi:diguanylate cyclase (GGDEF)-like protein/PAS domain S-box-containing protein
MDLLLDAVCVVDEQGCFIFVSAACERIFGYTPQEMLGKPMIELVFHEDRARTLQAVDEIVTGQPKPHFENRYVRKDGQIVHIMWSARWSEVDRVRVAVARDITERKRADSMQAALYAISEAAHTTADLPALFRQVHRVIGNLLPAVNCFVALYDADKDELSFPYYVDEYASAPAPRPLDSSTLSAEIIRSGRALLLTPDSPVSEQVRLDVGTGAIDWLGVPLIASKGCIGALVVQSYSGAMRYTVKDIELLQFVSTQVAAAIERKQMEARLQHIARHDQLTELPNRELVHDRLQIALALARREQTRLALLYLDLDMFKPINDTFGHAIGDLLLQEVARRLQQCVRESDTVGRVGGDEFLVLLSHIHLLEHATQVAEKILLALTQPFHLVGNQLSISPSIGIALYPDHGDHYLQLIRCADEAMYGAKKAGGNKFWMTASSPDSET